MASEYSSAKLRNPFWNSIKFCFYIVHSVWKRAFTLYWKKWTWNEKGPQEPDSFVAEWDHTPAHLWLLRMPCLFALVNYITLDWSKITVYWDGM